MNSVLVLGCPYLLLYVILTCKICGGTSDFCTGAGGISITLDL